MDQDVVCSERSRPFSRQARSHVATVLVCQNNLIRSGIDHVLSGTRFVISAEADEQTSEAPALCLIYTDHVADDMGETVNRLKTRWPSARTVLLSDHLGSRCCHSCLPSGSRWTMPNRNEAGRSHPGS